MGISYSVDSGFGVIIPEEWLQELDAKHEEDDYWDGVGEYLYLLADEYEYLKVIRSGSYYGDDALEYAVVLKSSARTSYGLGFTVLNPPVDNFEEYDLLNDELNKFFMEEFGHLLGDKRPVWVSGMVIS